MRVKICGLCRPGDAALAVRAGADLVGVILTPGFMRSSTVQEAAAILGCAGHARRVGVFVDADDTITDIAQKLRLDVLQLHGAESPERVAALRDAGAWRVWKSIHVRNADDVSAAIERYADVAHGLLLDGWSERAAGGTGTSFDWEAVAGIRSLIPHDVECIVGGGLTPDNVAEAASLLLPDVVDVSSGVESGPRRKSAQKMKAFVAAARAAAGSPG